MFDSLSLTAVSLIIGAYLLGSVSNAVLIARIFHLPDPRTLGSGNPGATNMLRTGHKSAAALTLVSDSLKGYLPVFLALHLELEVTLIAWVGLAAVLGHVFPVFFHFHGGKGVATTLGVCLAINPLMGLIQIGCWLLVALLSRISSLAALLTALVTPALSYWLAPDYLMVTSLLCLLMIYRHRDNLNKLIQGVENHL